MNSFGGIGLLLLQILIGSMNMVIGLLAVTYYALNVGPSGVATSPILLLQISLFAFIFGGLSFAIACLAAVPAFSSRSSLPQENIPRMEYEVYAPQIMTREYVTQRRRAIAEQAWTGLACPDCGRMVSREDNFCDACGAQFKVTRQPRSMPGETTEKPQETERT
jgi:hypothetical protein